MRNLENMPSEENEELGPKNDNLENFDLPKLDEPKESISAEETESIKEIQEESGQLKLKKDTEVINQQEKEIRAEIEEREDKGILSRLSKKGRKFAGVAILSLSSFSAGCHSEIGTPKTPELQSQAPIKRIATELPSKSEWITRKEWKAREARAGKIINASKPEVKLENAGKKEEINEQIKENEAGYSSENRIISSEYGSKENLDYVGGQTNRQEKLTERQIERRTIDNLRYFINNSTVVSMGEGSFAIDIPIAEEGGPVIVDVGERPCYKVEPDDLKDIERIRQEHFQKVNLALSRKPFSARMVAEGIRNRTERALKRVIRSCEELPIEQLPEEIKKSREKEQERIEEKKEKIKSGIEKNNEKTEEPKEIKPKTGRLTKEQKTEAEIEKEIDELIKKGRHDKRYPRSVVD